MSASNPMAVRIEWYAGSQCPERERAHTRSDVSGFSASAVQGSGVARALEAADEAGIQTVNREPWSGERHQRAADRGKGRRGKARDRSRGIRTVVETCCGVDWPGPARV